MDPIPSYRQYRVNLRSTAGMYAQYDGHVNVWSPTNDPDTLFGLAIRELGRTSFPDRVSRDFWVFESAEVLP